LRIAVLFLERLGGLSMTRIGAFGSVVLGSMSNKGWRRRRRLVGVRLVLGLNMLGYGSFFMFNQCCFWGGKVLLFWLKKPFSVVYIISSEVFCS